MILTSNLFPMHRFCSRHSTAVVASNGELHSGIIVGQVRMVHSVNKTRPSKTMCGLVGSSHL